jgi:L-noviosyl transferase
MRVLITTSPATNHYWPMVPLAWALRSAGHDVQVGCLADLAGEVCGSGLTATVVDAPEEVRDLLGDGDADPAAPSGAVEGRRSGPRFVSDDLRERLRNSARLSVPLVDGLLASVTARPPDVIVHEPLDFAGPLLAALAGVPTVLHSAGLPLGRQMISGMRRTDSALRTRYGLPDEASEPGLIVEVWPAGLRQDHRPAQAPGSVDDGGRHRVMRHVPYARACPTAEWTGRPAAGPRICLAAGIDRPVRSVDWLIGKAAGLPGAGLDVVLPLAGPDAADLGAAPEGIEVVPWLPLDRAAGACAAAVHAGDPAMMLAFLAAGIPQVVLPILLDERTAASALATAGAGISLPHEASAADVAAAVRAVVDSGEYGENAARVAAGMSRARSPHALVPDIEALAGLTPAADLDLVALDAHPELGTRLNGRRGV